MKKIKHLFTALLTVALIAVFFVCAAAFSTGDVDGDGTLTAADARLALRASVKLEELSDESAEAADVNGDGEITAADARIILRASVGLETLSQRPIVFEQTVLFDSDEYLVLATNLTALPNGFDVDIYAQNLTADKTFLFSVDEIYINGIGFDYLDEVYLLPGDMITDTLYISNDFLRKYGTNDDITLIEMYCFIVDAYSEDDPEWCYKALTPYGEENIVISSYKRTGSDIILFENEDFSAEVIDFFYDEDSGYYIAYIYMANNTDMPVMFYVDDISLNGKPLEFSWGNISDTYRDKLMVLFLEPEFFSDIDMPIYTMDMCLTVTDVIDGSYSVTYDISGVEIPD